MNQQHVLSILIQARIPVMLTGDPGIGKTAQMEGIAQALDLHLETDIYSGKAPEDVNGLPVLHNNNDNDSSPVSYAAAPSVYRLLKHVGRHGQDNSSLPGEGGLWFLDEVNQAPEQTQAALQSAIQDGRFAEVRFDKERFSVVAAGNPVGIATNGRELSAPMANRFAHVSWELDRQYFLKNWSNGFSNPAPVLKLPHDWRKNLQPSRVLLSAFLERMPQLIHALPKHEAERAGPWPSPRSWDNVSRAFAIGLSLYDSPMAFQFKELVIPVASSLVGTGPASSLLAWMKELSLPSPKEMLANPSMPLPFDRPDSIMVAFSSLVAHIISEDNNYDNHCKALDIAIRIKEQKMVDTIFSSLARLRSKEVVSKMNDARMPVQLMEFRSLFESLAKMKT